VTTINSSKPLILVDGSSYLFRAFHALPPLINSHGEPTGAIHGVLNMLDRLRKDYQPEHMVVIFDAKGKTFRHRLYSEYKSNRPPMPDDLRSQIEPLLDIIRAQGYPLLIEDDVEADDVIGTLATHFKGSVLISTGDKDMAQLVNERVHLINTMSNEYLDIEGIKKKFGVMPERIRDYLTLMGDKSDNIPGINKVGPKTAVKWLNQYESLENIMQHAEEFKGKIGEYLREALAHLPLSYQLVTIDCDLDINCDAEVLGFCKQDDQRLLELYQRYGFRTRLKALQKHALAAENGNEVDSLTAKQLAKPVYETILTQSALDEWIQALKRANLFAFDTETTSLNYIDAEIVGVSFCIKVGKAAYLPLAHDYPDAPQQLNREHVLAQLKPLLEDPSCYKVGQNLKYDRSVLRNHGIRLHGIQHDTMLQSYILNSTANRHDMNTLCEKYLDHHTIHFEDIAGKGKKQLTFNQITLEEAAPYAAEDADMTLRLHHHFWPQLQALSKQKALYENVEIPCVSILSNIECNGVHIDAEMLQQQSVELKQAMQAIQTQVYSSAGEEFNLSSPKQLQVILFDEEKLGLPILKKTPKGAPSTAEDVLSELANEYEIPRLILQYRSMSKLKSTYTDKLPKMLNAKTQQLHTSYHQAVTATGRLSSSDPNLQNIPVRNAAGRRIRQAFIAPEGYTLLAADYSQIELRIMAHLSQDEGLLNAFAAEQDIHQTTAAEIFEIELDQVDSDQRRAAKAVNFGLIYGMSAFGLAKQLGIKRGVAQAYIDRYFNRYPRVLDYMQQTRESAKSAGYVETLLGRRLYLPDINARNAIRRQYAERTAINAPMQGTAADIIKKAMINVDNWLQTEQLKSRMIMQVHDELVFEIADNELALAEPAIAKLMSSALTLDVPLLVDIGTGKNWDEAH
jgi:DNA polymerase-1